MGKIGVLATLVCVSGTLAACSWQTTVPDGTSFPTNRDPVSWPFAADSIWNMSIHNDAKYVDAQIGMPMEAGPTIDPEILILQPNALRVIHGQVCRILGR